MCLQKTTLTFPDDSGIEIEVEYDVDPELYSSGINVESVLLLDSKKPYWFSEFLNDSAFELIEKMVIQSLKDATLEAQIAKLEFGAAYPELNSSYKNVMSLTIRA